MIGTSNPEYIFIRFCIYGLHFVAPICILYTILAICLYGTQAALWRVPLIIECVALAESLFYLLVYIPYSYYLQREAVHPPPLSRAERKELFDLCNHNIGDPEKYMRKWFLGAELKEIKRENLKDFFLWAFFNRGGPPGDDDEELEEYVRITEKLLGREIQPGRGNAKCLRLTLDKVDMVHRSLAWYCAVGFVDMLTYITLLHHGFRFHRTPISSLIALFPFRPQALTTPYKSPVKYTSYWHRPHTSKTQLPIVFIHGIGIGLYPYTNFLSDLNSLCTSPDETIGILAIEILPVSFRITHAPLSKSALCEEINTILEHHGYSKFVLVSHSYGTVVSTHLLKSPIVGPKISATVLVDPVSILLHLPDVAYNFTRRKPQRANEWQLWYFASMDWGVSITLGRHFFWSECVLWKKDLVGRNVTVSLASDDLIVDTLECGRYLMAPSSEENPDGNLLDLDEDGKGVRRGMVRTSSDGTNGHLLDLDEGGHDGRNDATKSQTLGSEHGGSIGSDITRVNSKPEDLDAWKYREWTGKGIDVLWFEGIDHAQVFDKKKTREPLVKVIKAYSENSGVLIDDVN